MSTATYADKPNLTREEFEKSATDQLKIVVAKAKQIRESIRLLEQDVITKEKKIKNYQNALEEFRQELVKTQAILYAGGTT